MPSTSTAPSSTRSSATRSPAGNGSSTSASPATPELVPRGIGAEIHTLHPEVGFETFTARIHKVIEEAGRGAFYVFDCLSDLAADWYSDLMLGNFFMVTCPYLYDLDTVDLLRPAARRALVRRRFVDPRHDAVADRRLPPQGPPLRPSAEGRPAFLPDDVSPPRPRREGVPPPHGERGALRGAGGPLEAARGRRLRTLDIWDRKPSCRRGKRSTRSGSASGPGGRRRKVRPASPDDGHPRRAAGGPRLPVVRPRRPARRPEADDRHGTDRRQVGRDAARPRDPLHRRTLAGGTCWRRTTRSSSAPTSSTRSSSATAAGGCGRTSATPTPSWTGRRGARADPAGTFPDFIRSSSWRCSTTSASRRSSSARAACSRTASATPSRASTRASSARTRDRRRSGSRRSSRRSAPSTPAR